MLPLLRYDVLIPMYADIGDYVDSDSDRSSFHHRRDTHLEGGRRESIKTLRKIIDNETNIMSNRINI